MSGSCGRGPGSLALDGLTSFPFSWSAPSTRLSPPQTQMAQLAGLSVTGLGDQNAFNATVEAEHLGLARRTKGTAAALSAWEPGVGEGMNTRIRGKRGGAVCREEGTESLQDLGVETVN